MFHEISYLDPLQIFAQFADQPGSILLDSAQLRKNCARYSFIAVDPFQTLESKNGVIKLDNEVLSGNPFAVLAAQLEKFSQKKIQGLPPFQGGAAGFFGYELAHHLEDIVMAEKDDMQFPDMALGFYDCVIAFDEQEKRAWIFSNGFPEMDLQKREQRAHARLHALHEKIKQAPKFFSHVKNALDKKNLRSNFSMEAYQHLVRKVIDYILLGDIFEANISQRFSIELSENYSAFDLYRKLRSLNAAPFAAYVNLGNTLLVSASPERFLLLCDRRVETRPIKGTRPRGKNVDEDEMLAKQLLSSEKDHAENVMIVDLLRNDLSRVCEDHSVKVEQLCALESYATVHHLVSVVSGKLQQSRSAVDLLCATFPGGSITGAPKIRAMEIIAEIEELVRGPYCGSIGYIDFSGDMDLSITIRTIAIKNNIATFQVGGAIVADSDPCAEYDETLTKARALKNALVEVV